MAKILITLDNFDDSINEIILNLGVKRKDCFLLLEAYRRKHILDSAAFLLGFDVPSKYISKYFEPSFGEIKPKVKNWFKLTTIGLVKMEKLEEMIEIDETSKTLISSKIFRLF